MNTPLQYKPQTNTQLTRRWDWYINNVFLLFLVKNDEALHSLEISSCFFIICDV